MFYVTQLATMGAQDSYGTLDSQIFHQSMATSSASAAAPAPPSIRRDAYIAIHLVLARRLMVTHFDMDLNPTVPVKDLKAELASQLGVPATHQQWFYLNTLLDDSNTLESMGVILDSIVEVRPLPGFAPSPLFAAGPTELSAEAIRDQTSREV